jgi:hypothetical protein
MERVEERGGKLGTKLPVMETKRTVEITPLSIEDKAPEGVRRRTIVLIWKGKSFPASETKLNTVRGPHLSWRKMSHTGEGENKKVKGKKILTEGVPLRKYVCA